jgi:hypothetical protein
MTTTAYLVNGFVDHIVRAVAKRIIALAIVDAEAAAREYQQFLGAMNEGEQAIFERYIISAQMEMNEAHWNEAGEIEYEDEK